MFVAKLFLFLFIVIIDACSEARNPDTSAVPCPEGLILPGPSSASDLDQPTIAPDSESANLAAAVDDAYSADTDYEDDNIDGGDDPYGGDTEDDGKSHVKYLLSNFVHVHVVRKFGADL